MVGAGILSQDILTNGVNEGAKALGLPNAALTAEDGKDADEGFLADVVDPLRGKQPGAQHDPQELAKISYKVLLRSGVSLPQTVHVRLIEYIEFHPDLKPFEGSISSEKECRNETLPVDR